MGTEDRFEELRRVIKKMKKKRLMNAKCAVALKRMISIIPNAQNAG